MLPFAPGWVARRRMGRIEAPVRALRLAVRPIVQQVQAVLAFSRAVLARWSRPPSVAVFSRRAGTRFPRAARSPRYDYRLPAEPDLAEEQADQPVAEQSRPDWLTSGPGIQPVSLPREWSIRRSPSQPSQPTKMRLPVQAQSTTLRAPLQQASQEAAPTPRARGVARIYRQPVTPAREPEETPANPIPDYSPPGVPNISVSSGAPAAEPRPVSQPDVEPRAGIPVVPARVQPVANREQPAARLSRSTVLAQRSQLQRPAWPFALVRLAAAAPAMRARTKPLPAPGFVYRARVEPVIGEESNAPGAPADRPRPALAVGPAAFASSSTLAERPVAAAPVLTTPALSGTANQIPATGFIAARAVAFARQVSQPLSPEPVGVQRSRVTSHRPDAALSNMVPAARVQAVRGKAATHSTAATGDARGARRGGGLILRQLALQTLTAAEMLDTTVTPGAIAQPTAPRPAVPSSSGAGRVELSSPVTPAARILRVAAQETLHNDASTVKSRPFTPPVMEPGIPAPARIGSLTPRSVGPVARLLRQLPVPLQRLAAMLHLPERAGNALVSATPAPRASVRLAKMQWVLPVETLRRNVSTDGEIAQSAPLGQRDTETLRGAVSPDGEIAQSAPLGQRGLETLRRNVSAGETFDAVDSTAGAQPEPMRRVIARSAAMQAGRVTETSTPQPRAQAGYAALFRRLSRPARILRRLATTILPQTDFEPGTGVALSESHVPGAPVQELSMSAATRTVQVAARQVGAQWPVLRVVQQVLASVASHTEPAAVQVLRGLAPARLQPALVALAALPARGAGEPLSEGIRQPMERLVRRDLRNVRLYTDPVAMLLGAEAFTTGERVVFAPGRMNLKSGQGLALLGHELSHVGLPLAFKQLAGPAPEPQDPEERAAQQQEQKIRGIIQHGWPEPKRMDLRRMPAQTQAGTRSDSASSTRGLEGVNLIRGSAPQSVQRAMSQEQPVVSERTQRVDTHTSEGSTPLNVDKLARQVYDILKTRLRAERDRHPFDPR
ncbi:MAG: DUF4157 domain-containing protein [Anaerolineae bacterium]